MFGGMSKLWITSFVSEFENRIRLKTNREDCLSYGQDHTEDLVFCPDVVAEVTSKEDVRDILKWAYDHDVAVTPSGALTGLSGGALPVNGGVALSFRRMNRILEVDEVNQQVRLEPGVIVEELQRTVAEKGLFYAVDPASKGSCTIGGNIAENSGGPRAVKYGVTKDWVLNLEVVLMDGMVLKTGADTLKNSTGYNLTSLMVGSEGTLGVVTEATLKLLPLPAYNALILVPFLEAMDACRAVAQIFKAGASPSAIEFMEREAIELAQEFTGDHSLALDEGVKAHLLIEVDGFRHEDLWPQLERIMPVLEENGAGEPLFADDAASKERLWFLRRRVGEAVKARSVYKEEDTVVPRGELPKLLEKVKELGREYGFTSICYGHAGDGNLHVNILKMNLSDEEWNRQLPGAIERLFQEVIRLGGTISGEHGIGWVQKPYMHLAFPPEALAIQKSIKRAFDPKGLLNPGKIFPD